jgi:cytochrome c biogenesis protein CcmG/thiol:disulfide interchange protein DsbE
MLAAMLAALIVGGIAILRSSSDSIGAGGPAAVAMVDRTALNPAVTLLKVGKPAPDFAVRSESGGRVSLSSQRGHPVLLEFFAVWCPVCHRETPVMHSLTAAYHAKGLRTLAVLANPYGPEYEISRGKDLTIATASDLRWYARTYRANYPLLVDRTFASVNRYGAGSYPTIYLIDASGKVAYAAHGAVPRTALAARIQKLVSRTS